MGNGVEGGVAVAVVDRDVVKLQSMLQSTRVGSREMSYSRFSSQHVLL